MLRLLLIFCLVVLLTSQAFAKDLSFDRSLVQSQFRRISEQAATLFSYKNVAPATPLGVTGFDAGIEASAIRVDSDLWDKAFEDDAPSYLVLPRIRARKGLPYGIDVGAMVSTYPDSNISLVGAEVSMALLEGSIVSPAVGIRGTYTRLLGVDDLDFQTAGADISISKGFAFITPYAGVGAVWVVSEPSSTISFLKTERFWQPRGFAGLELKPLPLFRLVGDVEYSDQFVYTLKLAVGF